MMKKRLFLCFICLVFLFSFAACNKNEGGGEVTSADVTSEETVTSKEPYHLDIAALAAKGDIPEIEIALGTYVGTVKETYGYKEAAESGTEITESELDDFYYHGHDTEMRITNQDDYVKIDIGTAYFYYKSIREGSGISRIVSLKNSYDFETGAAVSENIKNAVDAQPTREESGVTVDFLPAVGQEFSVIEYNFDKIALEFYFVDDFLTCTVLTNTELWN